MKAEDVQPYLKKEIKIFMKNKFIYTGIIKSVTEDTVVLTDRYGKGVTIDISDISILTEPYDKEKEE